MSFRKTLIISGLLLIGMHTTFHKSQLIASEPQTVTQDYFQTLPDEIATKILVEVLKDGRLSDFYNLLLTSKRLNRLLTKLLEINDPQTLYLLSLAIERKQDELGEEQQALWKQKSTYYGFMQYHLFSEKTALTEQQFKELMQQYDLKKLDFLERAANQSPAYAPAILDYVFQLEIRKEFEKTIPYLEKISPDGYRYITLRLLTELIEMYYKGEGALENVSKVDRFRKVIMLYKIFAERIGVVAGQPMPTLSPNEMSLLKRVHPVIRAVEEEVKGAAAAPK